MYRPHPILRTLTVCYDGVLLVSVWSRSYVKAKTGRLDTHRAANELVRNTVDGRIVLALRPPAAPVENRGDTALTGSDSPGPDDDVGSDANDPTDEVPTVTN